MAYVEGCPLSQRLKGNKFLPIGETVALVRKIALALAYAHQTGVVHRDLKPANIMIDSRGEPIVMDFGLARRSDEQGSRLTATGEVIGTIAYMPPEQLSGDLERIGPHSDVYSLGVILYELLTGCAPFHGDMMALAMQISADPPAPPSRRKSGLDPELDAIVLRALEKDPARRWPSMTAFADALSRPHKACAGGLTLHVAGTPYAYRAGAGQRTVVVGRQRRKPDSPAGEGCDFVVRVAGDDELSLRISRRHLEFIWTENGWSVIHHGRTPTERNGVALTPGVPTPLVSGDRLSIAGALTVFVDFESTGGVQVPEVTLPTDENRAARLLLDATCGDMVNFE
jgi:hypothetical protein